MKYRLVTLFAIVLSVAIHGFGQEVTIVLQDGTVARGTVVSTRGNTLVITLDAAIRSDSAAEVSDRYTNSGQRLYGSRDGAARQRVEFPGENLGRDYRMAHGIEGAEGEGAEAQPSPRRSFVSRHRSAITNTVVGAGAGAVIGNNTGSGNGARGAAYGAAAGLLTGLVQDAMRR
jgi:hypothetical protein